MHQEQAVMQVIQENLVLLVSLVNAEHQGTQVPVAKKVHVELQDQLETMAQMEPQDHVDLPDLQVFLVHPDQ